MLGLLLVALALTACGGDDDDSAANSDKVASVDLDPNEATIDVGEKLAVRVTPRNADGVALPHVACDWSSNEPDWPATVDSHGVVTGRHGGMVYLSVTCEKASNTIYLTVLGDAPAEDGGATDGGVTGQDGGGNVDPGAPIASIKLSPKNLDIVAGDTLQLTAALADADGNAIDRPEAVSWKSSNAKVARVSANGVLEPLKEGKATITATAEGESATATVKVYPAQPGVISAGGNHACGVTRFGHAYCWGRASDGSIGIGDPIPMQMDADHVYHFDQCEPKEVKGGRLFRSVSAGGSHTCGITVDGDTYCWGTMTALGDGKLNPVIEGAPPSATSPVLVKGGVEFASIAAGNDITCGVTGDGEGYCWGSAQASHRLGNNTTDDQPLPKLVAGDHQWQVIRPGDFTVGLDTDGHAFQWGMTLDGDVATPTPVAGDHVFTEISVAGSRALGLDTDGKIWGWGDNHFGTIGDGTQQDRSEPTAVMVNGVTFKKLAVGGTSAAISTDNRLYWWGLFNFNETVEDVVNGNSRQQDYLTPADLAAYNPEQLVSGSSYVLGATDGTVAGIGMNDHGQLGVGCLNYATSEFLGSHVSSYELEVGGVSDQAPALSIDSGGKVTVPISVQRFGGFSLNGIGFPEDITLTVDTSGEANLVDATIEPSVLEPGVDHATLTVVAPPTGGLTTAIGVSASAQGDQTPHQSTMNVAVSGVVAAGVELALTCPDPTGVLPHSSGSPNRYQCMQAQPGVQAPGQYAGDAKFRQLTEHVWVDETVGDCIYWGHNYAGFPTPSQGFVRARNGGNSGAEAMNSALGAWGVLVKMSGVPEGGDEWLVFTDSADPQVRGLMVDMATTPPTIEGWNFKPMDSCPW